MAKHVGPKTGGDASVLHCKRRSSRGNAVLSVPRGGSLRKLSLCQHSDEDDTEEQDERLAAAAASALTPRPPAPRSSMPSSPLEQQPRTTPPLERLELLSVLGTGAFGRVFLTRRPRPQSHRKLRVAAPSAQSLDPRSPPRRQSSSGSRSSGDDSLQNTHDEDQQLQQQRQRQQDEAALCSALKVLRKRDLRREGAHADVSRELRLLRRARGCPFIAQLRDAFQTETHVMLELEFCQGGELFSLLGSRGRLPPATARFYLGEIALALEWLHVRSIYYGDLKPENVALSADGHVKLLDFGLSKDLSAEAGDPEVVVCPHSGRRAVVTPSGSLLYAAPEQLKREPASLEADWWSLGVLAFECLTGQMPFEDGDAAAEGRSEDPNVICELICAVDLVLDGMDELLECQHAESFVGGLLVKEPVERLGAREGLAEIAAHPFFEGGPQWWERLRQGIVEPPLRPLLSGPTDVSQFSETFTSEPAELQAAGNNDDQDNNGGDEEAVGWERRNNSFADFELRELVIL